jgi:hypothetical protein
MHLNIKLSCDFSRILNFSKVGLLPTPECMCSSEAVWHFNTWCRTSRSLSLVKVMDIGSCSPLVILCILSILLTAMTHSHTDHDGLVKPDLGERVAGHR